MNDCQFPGACLMPGDHLPCECHTVEMIEAYNRTADMSLCAFMDYLTHDVEATEWDDECDGKAVQTPAGRADLGLLVADPCLADPQLSAWKNAYVWRLIERYGDAAVVVQDE